MSPSVWLHPARSPAAGQARPPVSGSAKPASAPPAAAAHHAAAASPAHGHRRAYVTLLTKDAYLPGVQALARSLRLVRARYPLIVMYTRTCSQSALEALASEPGVQLQFAEQFEADGDHLFELPPGFYAVGDCYGGREYAEERESCCHFTPDATPEYFNAGFYVMTPSLAELEEMRAALREGRVKGKWRHLPYSYNGQKRIKVHHPDLWDMSDIYIIHYVDEKPWSHRYSEENLAYKEECDYWWDVFEGHLASQALPRRQMSTGLDGIPASAFELLPIAGEEPAAATAAAAASLSRAPTPLSQLQLSRAPTPVGPIERASSLTAALPQQSAV
ncbi:glycosyl transferase [Chlorella sorokiniana]|uniref:Glycosyl transferase n=1 Tax=Chlorella sorokiniana TaxID=3076 RepID=A0A2P6TPM2_CHLSO|nr:glycosyl transferase [Chlorella sorokiniana]|eukprot:PRW55990.1 glycosyl transferase [Chlorella sorokiniana]